MPGYLTDSTNNKVLDLVFGASAYTAPVTLYFGLSQGVASKSGAITELAGSGYTRVAKTNNATNFPAAAGGTKQNGTSIVFPTAAGAWGPALSLFVADAPSGGNVLAMADLPAPLSVPSGKAASFAVN